MAASTDIEFAHLQTYFNSTHIESPTLQNSLKEIYKIINTNGTPFVSVILNCKDLSWGPPQIFTYWCNGFYILYNNPDNVNTMSLGTFVLFTEKFICTTTIAGKKTDFSDARASQWYNFIGR